MSVSESMPYGQPAEAERIEIVIRLGGLVRSPAEVQIAIVRSITEYGVSHDGTLTPFNQQPGFPRADILDPAGTIIGHWEVKGAS